MIFWDESYLMNSSLDGLAGLSNLSSLFGLSCGGGCKCDDCSSLRGIGAAWENAWYCNGSFLSSLIPECTPPTVSEIINNPSDCGKSLTPENCRKAAEIAKNVIDEDDPCNYSEINGMSAIDKILKCGQVNWWMVGGVILGGAIVLKKI